jgi:hypothetical protein
MPRIRSITGIEALPTSSSVVIVVPSTGGTTPSQRTRRAARTA